MNVISRRRNQNVSSQIQKKKREDSYQDGSQPSSKKISIINNKFLMSVIISSLKKFQTEYTGTRPGDISISSCNGSFRSLIQTLFLNCNNKVARREK